MSSDTDKTIRTVDIRRLTPEAVAQLRRHPHFLRENPQSMTFQIPIHEVAEFEANLAGPLRHDLSES